MEVDVMLLSGVLFEQLLGLLYMYPLSLLLPLLSFEWTPAVISQNLLKLTTCLSFSHLCLDSLTLVIKAWHPQKVSSPKHVPPDSYIYPFPNCWFQW